MKKTLMGLLALGMSAIMSVSALAAGSVKGTEIVESDIKDGYKISVVLSDVDITSKKVTEAYSDVVVDSNASSVDVSKLVAVENQYDIVVTDLEDNKVEYPYEATIKVNCPKLTEGNTYYVVFGDEADGTHLAKIEGSVGTTTTSSNGAVLADMTVPTVSGQDITLHYSNLNKAFFTIYYVQNGQGDVNPVIPVLAAVVVVSAAGIIVFKKRRA